jgi:hypothetical protein
MFYRWEKLVEWTKIEAAAIPKVTSAAADAEVDDAKDGDDDDDSDKEGGKDKKKKVGFRDRKVKKCMTEISS